MSNHKPLTPTMRAELAHIAKYGIFRGMDCYSFGPLAFYAREKVLTALINRGLIADAETITDAGRAVLTNAQKEAA